MKYFVIAKRFFDSRSTSKIDGILQLDWERFIFNNSDLYTWMEETEFGKNRRLHMDSIPILHKNRVRKLYGKKQALADLHPNKPHSFNLECTYEKNRGIIEIRVYNNLSIEVINMLKNMANNLNSHIFSVSNGVVIDDTPFNINNIS